MKYFTSLFLIVLALTSRGEAALSLSEIMQERHSGRSYEASRSVSVEQLRLIADAARLSPSSHNEQPWHVIICDRTISPEAYQKALSSLKESNQAWAKNASTFMIITAKANYSRGGKVNRFSHYDTGAAAISMAYKATELGLMAHQVGGFNLEAIREVFAIPEEYTPITIMILGYETSEASQNKPPKERKQIGENFFIGNWGRNFLPE